MAKIFCAVPVYATHSKQGLQGQVHPAFEYAFNETIRHCEGRHVLTMATVGGDACLDRARAFLFGQFLQGDYDYFMQLDADIQWAPDTFDRLISHDKDVVGALYAFKVDKGHPKHRRAVFRGFYGQNIQPDENGLLEISGLAGGFIMVRANAFHKLIEDRPEEVFYMNPDYGEQEGKPGCGLLKCYHFWQPITEPQPAMGGKPEYLSEDYALCKRFRDSGFKIYADMRVCLRHWSGDDHYELLREGEEKAA